MLGHTEQQMDPTVLLEALKTVIRRTIVEAGHYKAGEEYEAMEKAAKERYESAVANLEAWDENERRRLALPGVVDAILKSKKISKDNARKEAMADPTTKYDVKLAQKKRASLENDVQKAEQEYADYEPEATLYNRRKTSGGAKTTAAKEMPPPGKRVYMDINDVTALQWYPWPKVVAKSGKQYGAAGTKTGEEMSGTGPGEEWLAYVFGGQAQGGGVSFDIVTPDGRTWEVKALETSTTTVRPGTEGRKAFEKPRKRLERIMAQMRLFVAAVKKSNLGESLSDVDNKIISYVSAFIDDDFEMIVGKGEISEERFVAFRSALKALNKFKEFHHNKNTDMKTAVDTRVSLNDKEKKVDKPTFIDIAKKVEKSTGDSGVLSDFEEFDLLISTLKDSAFDDPKEFFNEWFSSVNIHKIFSQVDGVFIVNRRGFTVVPQSYLDKAFRFTKVSQMQPRFSFVAPWGP